MIDQISVAIAERNRILIDMDQDAAKAFVVEHGGKAPKRLDWEIVLHLARCDVETISDDLRQESRIFLARSGYYGITSLPQNSFYARAAMDLIFPHDLTEAFIRQMEPTS